VGIFGSGNGIISLEIRRNVLWLILATYVEKPKPRKEQNKFLCDSAPKAYIHGFGIFLCFGFVIEVGLYT